MPETLDEHEAQSLAVAESESPLPALADCPFCGNAGVHFDQPDEDRNVVGCRLGHVKMRSPEAWNTRAQQWRPIETAPKPNIKFLAFVPFGKGQFARKNHQIVGYLAPSGHFLSWPGAWTYTPTHWQPLPAPPREDE